MQYKEFIKILALLMITTVNILLPGCQSRNPLILNVAAGVGLTDALTEINNLYMEAKEDIVIVSTFAAAGDLQTQIKNGAPVDIFFSAGSNHMDLLDEKDLILRETRRDVVGNKLVLITNINNPHPITTFTDLLKSEVKLIAMGDPEFVPAGNYGLLTLEYLDISYKELRPKTILGNNVRQVLYYVENNAVDYGMVYYTDALISRQVQTAAIAPAYVNNKIVFPVAVVTACKNRKEAIEYINFLFSPEADAIFMKYGFQQI